MGAKKKVSVILDIDNTLVHSIVRGEETLEEPYKKYGLKLDAIRMDEFWVVFRPFLREFLRYLFDNFNVAVWSLGEKEYVNKIVDAVILRDDPNRKLEFIFSRDQSEILEKKGYSTKDLRYIWILYSQNMDKKIIRNIYGEFKGLRKWKFTEGLFTPQNTLIIDDTTTCCNTTKRNHIHIPEFTATDELALMDNHLIQTVSILDKAKEAEDVRKVSKSFFTCSR